MSRSYKSPARYEEIQATHKDNVISSLKRELFELKDLEHDFIRLNNEVANIESKYALLLDEKERSQNQHKNKIEISKKNLTDLRNDVDNLKMQIHQVSVQIDDTVRENSTLKRMCDNREAEISALMASNREIQRNNEIQIEENKNMAMNLKNLKEERNRNEEQCDRLNKLLDESVSTLKQLQKEARQLEASNTKLDSILVQAEQDHKNLIEEMKQKEAAVDAANKKLTQLNQESEDLKEANSKLEKQCQKVQNEYKDLCQNLEESVSRNKDLSQRLKSLENTLRTTESELDQSIIKRENLRKEHMDLATENKNLNNEIDQCLLSILEYERINKDLQKEVENYIACDEEARSLLNRKEAMRTLLQQVSTKLHKTEEQIAHLR